MNYKVLGLSGLRVSPIGLGCMGMSHAYGAPADRRQMTGLLADAVDMGYTFSIRRRSMEPPTVRMITKNCWARH